MHARDLAKYGQALSGAVAAGKVPLLSDRMHAELRRYSAPRNSDVTAMDSTGRRSAQQTGSTVYCQGIARTLLPPMAAAADGTVRDSAAMPPAASVGYGHGGDTLGFRCKLLWVDGPADHRMTDRADDGDGDGGGKSGFVLAAMTNIGTMHCGLSRSPFDLWMDHILLPTVRAAAPELEM